MKWDTVAVSIRSDQSVEDVEREMQFLQNCGLFETTSLLIVGDPCDDIGSAGSALNALLNTVEHLCAQRGLSVLNESLLEKSKILILLLGESKESLPMGAGFLPSLKFAECPWIVPDYPVVHTIRNLNELAMSCDHGVWICGFSEMIKAFDGVAIILFDNSRQNKVECKPVSEFFVRLSYGVQEPHGCSMENG
ncbi:hypothetical protein COOONC_00774 [Cooperia oncophora]